jgi:ribonuclease R
MRDQVGERFGGTVSAVTSFGAFVEIDAPFVEGLIKLDSLGEPYDYDQVHMRLSGRRTGRTLELCDRVTVEINNVSVVRRRIDFTLIDGGGRASDQPKLEASPRASVSQKRSAGHALERAGAGREDRGDRRGGARASATGGKLRLGVSHRGMRERSADDAGGGGGGSAGGGRRKKPARRKR